MTQSPVFFPLGGGLDLITPALTIKPGRVVASLNYEPVLTGYRRMAGYERFDGRASPSTATVCAVHFFNGNADMGALSAGDEIYQQPDGEPRSGSGYVLADPILTDGSYADGDALGYVLIVPEKGQFVEDMPLISSMTLGMQYGALDTVPDLGGNDPLELLRYARNLLRGNILAVPGSGPVRGIWFSGSRAYAVRDNEAGDAGIPYYSELDNSASIVVVEVGGVTITVGGQPITLSLISDGWVPATTERVLEFTDGEVQPNQGDTIEQGATSALVRRIIVDSGSFDTNDATGRAYVVDQSGAFTAGDVLVGATTMFTVAGDSVENIFPPGGRYQFITHNFYGSENLERVYGVNGVGPAFEFDGTTIVEISTGMEDDRPTRVAAYKKHLFLSFPGGSLQHSSPGEPRVFNPITGAAEIGIGDEITDLLPMPDSLGVLGESSVNVLYGNNVLDFVMSELTNEAGGLPWTAQRIGDSVYLDNRGLRSLKATSAYGNFSVGTLSMMFDPLLADLRRDQVNPTASLVVRSKSQYIVFFEDGTAIIFLFGKKEVEALPVALGVKVTCAASVEDNGVERSFIGTDTGYVFELNRGASFDGAAIDSYLRLPYNHFGSPQVLKRAHKVLIDMETGSAVDLDLTVDMNLGTEPGEAQEVTVTNGANTDNTSFYELYFASQIESVGEAWLNGSAKNFSLKIASVSDIEEPHTLTGVTYLVSARGLRR